MEELFEDLNEEFNTVDFKRYIKAVLHRWWVVGSITLVIVIPWILHIKNQSPVYSAKAWVSFERVGEGVPQNWVQNRMVLLRSRSFAEEATADLGLTLEIIEQEDKTLPVRQEIFDVFYTNSDPQPGRYKIIFYPTGYCAIYSETELLDSLRIDDSINGEKSYNGFTFSLAPDVDVNNTKIEFQINDFRGAVNSLRARETVNFNREGNLLSIALKDRDPVLACRTVNKLADIFIQKSIDIVKKNRGEQRDFLQNQLQIIQKDLTSLDKQVKEFQNNHLIGLDEEKKRAVAQYSELARDSVRTLMEKNELLLLLDKFDYTNPSFDALNLGHYLYRQITSLGIFDNNSEMMIAKRQIDDYDKEKQRLRDMWSETNPGVIEISEKIADVENKVIDLAKLEIKDLDRSMEEIRKGIQEKRLQLSTLPAEVMAETDLMRRRRVQEEIHSV